jgi:hydroxymethylglutaryl-CoA synthase
MAGNSSDHARPGVSGMSLYVPALRVPLEAWSGWTNNPWAKVQSIVGNSFRVTAPDENVYTMAASAVLRLIRSYDVDPSRIGYLALGTETSTDNSAGSVIVRGMVDRALEELGLPRISRSCEVPELKHACLGGVYAMKAAARYLALDGADKVAIVVCADIAEYERGSSGEQTQGAGAVALLMEPRARLFELDLARAGSASDYRGPDFRKPHARHFVEGYAKNTKRLHDFPVFSGKYSTYSYLEETIRAFEDMSRRLGVSALEALTGAAAIFFHRPYHHMPVQAAAFLYLLALLESSPDNATIAQVCKDVGANRDDLVAEAKSRPDLYGRVLAGTGDVDPYPVTSQVVGALRKSAEFKSFLDTKMSLGSRGAADLGNLYTAALPAWMAAGFEEALTKKIDLAERRLLAVGYGSGDAAEAIPVRVAPDWAEAAKRIGFGSALGTAADITQAQYESLHDTGNAPGLPNLPGGRFRIHKVGQRYEPGFQDLGIEYYEYVR